MANLLSTNVSGRLYTSGHVDTAITNAAFRFYDGTTFRGGLGLDDWAHGGSSNDLTLYVANNGSLFITTNSIKRHFFNSGEAAFRTYAPDLNYKISVTGGDQLNAYYGSGAATLYLQYHGASGGALNVANGKLTVNTAGSVVASGDMRAPVFYDSADTSYYVDPNSYSRIYRTSTHIAPSPGVGSSNWVNDFNATPTSSMSFGGDLSSGGPQGTWWFQQNFRHSNSSNYWGTQVAWGWEDNANELWQRNVTGGSWSGWVRYINTNNYTGILDSRYQQSSTAITTSNIGSQSVSYASSAGSVAWNNVTSKPSLDYQQDYVFTAPNSTDGSGYSWVRVSMGGFNAGGDFVRFSISRAIFWNGSSPYGGPSMDVVAYSREWHGGQEGAVITYAEHGSVPGNGWVTNAGPRDLAGGGYWFYMRIWGGVDYAMRVYRGCGPIGTNWEETSDPGSIFKVKLGVNNIGAQHTGFNTNGQVRGDIYYDYNDEGYYGDFNGRSVLNSLQLGTASSDTTNLKLDVQGNMAIRGANGLYFGVSTNNFNSWSTRIYASGSTQYFNAQTFIFDNQGYGSSTFVVINSSGVTINGNTAIHSGNIGSQSVSYATSAGNSDTLDSLDSSEFARGRAAFQVLSLDAIKQPGLYQYDGGISGTQPEGTDQANLRTIEIGSSGRYSQMAFDWASEQAWFRRQTGSTWSTWREFIHSGNIGSQSVGALQGYSAFALIEEARGTHSGSDFPNGTLVTTDINASEWAGASFVMEVSGKSYSSHSPFKLIMQGYLYADTVINVSAMSYGSYFPAPVKVMNLNGNLAFWWPRGSYWNSFEVHVRDAGGDSWNRVTGISDSVDPPSATKKVSCTPIQVIHTNNIASQSVSYATTSGTSAATAQTNFASLTVGGLDVATREYVTSQGYLTSLPSHNHDDRYYTETEINSITHQWEWRWIRRAGYLGPASGSATDWTNYYLSYFTERTNATEGSYPEQASGYINTITNVDSSGGFGGSTYGNIFGDLDSYHCLIYTNIFVEKEFRVTVSNFNGDDPHAIFIDGVFVHGNTGCCVDTSYIYTFKPGWHRIDLIYSEGGGGDFIRMGWNPKDYTGNIKDMTPHRAGENPRNILDKIKSLVVQSDQSVRAPIFYDSADTSYYIDPNATSRIDRLQVVSNWGGSTPNDGQINIRGMYPSMTFRNTVSNSMWLRHMDGDGHVQHYFATGGVDSVNWGIKHTMFNDGTFFSSGSMRSPIFYDSNDTTYYLDPASNATSLNVRGVIRNPSIWINDGDDYNSYNENIRLFDAPNGVSVIAFSATGTSGSPRTSILGFSDRLETRVADNWQQRIYNGYVEASGSFRAPIFYDSNDTNYFVDPNSISQLNYVLANNWFRPQGSTGLYFQTYGRGIWSADSAGASYGNVSIYGDGINSWPGYAINNLAIFMARDIRRGIFIPSADSWLIRYEQSSNMAFVDFELQWGSDIRYKSNIKRLTGALDTVKQLKGVTYNYKGNERTSIGFIAQEVEPVLPEVVSTDGDGFKSVGYANIVALLSEAIKEQQVMIEQLKARIDILESK